MKPRTLLTAISLFLCCYSVFAGLSNEIAIGVLDQFEDDNTQGWDKGPACAEPNCQPTTIVPDGGDQGAGDAYLENTSTGGNGPGSRQIILNRDPRWTGDYIAAGVIAIRVNAINFSAEPLPLRLAMERPGIDCWSSTVAFILPADGNWHSVEFAINETDMTDTGGISPGFEQALAEVSELRVLASANPSCRGDRMVATVGYDDFESLGAEIDTDFDGVPDSEDNCTLIDNAPVCIGAPQITDQLACESAGNSYSQIDSDDDGFGNACDPDIAPVAGGGDCTVNLDDLAVIRSAFFSQIDDSNYDEAADMAYDGAINLDDLAVIRAFFFGPPGPGTGNCNLP